MIQCQSIGPQKVNLFSLHLYSELGREGFSEEVFQDREQCVVEGKELLSHRKSYLRALTESGLWYIFFGPKSLLYFLKKSVILVKYY